jgi:hypothetical protein
MQEGTVLENRGTQVNINFRADVKKCA